MLGINFLIKFFWILGVISFWGNALAQNASKTVPNLDAGLHPAMVTLWPSIPFTRAKDLCQYYDAYGQSKNEQLHALTLSVRNLLRDGIDSNNIVEILNAMDLQVSQMRLASDSSPGMDALLVGSLKAAVDKVYQERSPQIRRLNFFNLAPLNELLKQINNSQRKIEVDPMIARALNGIAYGTYSYAPTCQGDLVVTLHIELSCGHNYHYQAKGFPEEVMQSIGQQIFDTFQKTQFPSKITMGNRSLELIGAPSGAVGTAPSPKSAEMACKASKARLPTEDEYEYLSNLGDWNGGVACTKGKLWAMADNMVMAPDLPNPSPVRSVTEFPGQNFNYYCVR